MLCPKCGNGSRIVDTRNEPKENEVYRLHRCKSCGHVFYTVELLVEENKQFRKVWSSTHRYREWRRRKTKDVNQYE